MIKTERIGIIYLYQILILLTPVLNGYLLFPVPFIYIVCACGVILFLYMALNGSVTIEKREVIYAAYVVLFSVVNSAILTPGFSFYSLIARTSYFLLIFINFYVFAYQIWDYERSFKLYKNLCYLFSTLIIIQFILGHIGIRISLIPPGLTTNTADLMSTDIYRMNQIKDCRFSSFFLEPSYQAQYCLPCMALILFSKSDTRKMSILSALLITGGILTTTSMLGILGAGIVWCVYLLVLFKDKKLTSFQRLLLLTPFILVGIVFIMNQPVIHEQFQKKIWSFNGGKIQKDTSLYVRMIYGWDCYKDLGFITKLFGYGYSNSGTYLLSSGIGLKHTTIGLIGYMSGISAMFCELGIIGVILNFNVVLFPLLKKQRIKYNFMIHGLLITIIIIMFTSSSFDTISSLLPLTFARSLLIQDKGAVSDVATC